LNVDTIAAVSTAPGHGAIAVIRVSGPAAPEVLRRVAPSLAEAPSPRTCTLVEIRRPSSGELVDRAIATVFAEPASYTGEHMVELSCHGGPLIPGLVLDACIQAGARPAEPGEFTRRAYLRGKMDLLQAEAVADLIQARSRAFHRAAIGQLERGLSGRIGELRESLVKLEALMAHHIDFPEEDDAPVSLEAVAAEASRVIARLDGLLATAPEGELLRDGALAVFAGRPNAGKSSLYNALIGQDRAIVTDEPGTTRDALEASVQLAGFPFRLVDTAGLRETEARIEQLGVEVALKYLKGADIVLLCVPVGEAVSSGERRFLEGITAPVVLLETKADLPGQAGLEARSLDGFAGVVRVSVTTGEGLDEIARLLPELAYQTLTSADDEAPIITRGRHARALRTARDAVELFRAALTDGLPPEVASTHLRPAETALEEVLGVISVDDVLDVVFREFCVGK